MTGIENILEVSEKRGQFTTEQAFEKRVCDIILDRCGSKSLKMTGYKGMPDRFVFPDHFIEFKINFFLSGQINTHKNWTTHQRQWAKDIHDMGGKSWYCCLLQHKDTKKKYIYFEPAVWSLWAHKSSSFSLDSYEEHMLVAPARGERLKDHIWERLGTDYYERTYAPFRDIYKKTPTSEEIDQVPRHPKRLAPGNRPKGRVS